MHNTSMMNDFPYLYRGVVVDNEDPMRLGRCRIRVPSIHGDRNVPKNYLPWSRCISTMPVNSTSGSSYIPDIGDIVWVFFEGGDKDSPVYFGGTRGTGDFPAELGKVIIYQDKENKISYDKKDSKFFINVSDNSIEISNEGITISSESHVQVNSPSVTISSENINLGNTVNINGVLNFDEETSNLIYNLFNR